MSGSPSIGKGDVCATADIDSLSSCPAEPRGVCVLSGVHEVTVTFDGEVACDGCGTVSVDGVDEGLACAGG